MAERVVVLGTTDRGKTFTLAQLAREASRGRKVAVVDLDTGQSEVGPPGTVGWAWARPETEKLGDLKPAGIFFVGALSPAAAALEQVVASVQAVRAAEAAGADLLFIDTPGYAIGPGARRFLTSLLQALEPTRLLYLEQGTELGNLISTLNSLTGAEATALPVSEAIVRKSSSVRATRRLTRLTKALEGAQQRTLPLESVALIGATLGTGEPLAPHLARWAGVALRLPIVYAERADGTLTLFSSSLVRPGWEVASGPVADQLGASRVRVLALPALEGTCLGLHDSAGRFLALGRFVGLDTERGALQLETVASPERIALVSFGRFRLAADGTLLGELKPGEL